MKSYIQPFERRLAIDELSALTRNTPVPVDHDSKESLIFRVSSPIPAERLARHLAYWEVVMADRPYLTTQVLREATSNVVRNGVAPGEIQQLLITRVGELLPNRRCLRYGIHGLHEYRGKFFPQLVRALLNIAKIPPRGVIADPMCGSGTTAVETIVSGHTALGLDLNPMSVFMARTKCAALTLKPSILGGAYEEIRTKLMRPSPKKSSLKYFEQLPVEDQDYLKGWFSEQVLADLDQVATTIQQMTPKPVRDFMLLALSNILRRVSWQKDDDLRIRKEIRLDEEIDPVREFLEELGRSVRLALAFLYHFSGTKLGTFDLREADARKADTEWKPEARTIDAVITSPPYATALPYLDTDRLSLCYLGLLSRPYHRKYDQEMVGNREITETRRQLLWAEFKQKRAQLPSTICELIEKVEDFNSRANVGFRRKNLPSLLARYFMDMGEVFKSLRHVLKPGAPAFIVIGNNHTIAGDRRVDIETASLLAELATAHGFQVEARIPMEMLVSRDIFRKNAMASEEIICFRNLA